jgi:hypothetical protein
MNINDLQCALKLLTEVRGGSIMHAFFGAAGQILRRGACQPMLTLAMAA